MNGADVNKIKDAVFDCIDIYVRIADELSESADSLHSVWNDEAGDALFRRSEELAGEMEENAERIRRCCGLL